MEDNSSCLEMIKWTVPYTMRNVSEIIHVLVSNPINVLPWSNLDPHWSTILEPPDLLMARSAIEWAKMAGSKICLFGSSPFSTQWNRYIHAFTKRQLWNPAPNTLCTKFTWLGKSLQSAPGSVGMRSILFCCRGFSGLVIWSVKFVASFRKFLWRWDLGSAL